MWYSIHVSNEPCEKPDMELRVLAQTQFHIWFFIGRQPVSEKERSEFELTRRVREATEENRRFYEVLCPNAATAREREGAKRIRAATARVGGKRQPVSEKIRSGKGTGNDTNEKQ